MTNGALVDRLRAGTRLLLRPTGALPRLSRRGQVFDISVALVLFVAAIEEGGGSGDAAWQVQDDELRQGEPPAAPPPPIPGRPFLPIEQDQTGWEVVMLLVVLPLVLRRRFPLATLWVVLATAPLVTDFNAALRVSFYACVIAAYSAAVYSRYPVPALASLPVAALLYSQLREDTLPTVPDGAVPFLILIPVAFAADGLRGWKRRADEDRARLSALQREQVEALRRATEHERARIARELHDVVTHNVSVMVIQAGAARKVMDTTPDQARAALLAVEAGGRAAMAELRHVMGLLTMDSDGTDPAGGTDLTPQPDLDRIEELIARVRDTGIAVALTRSGHPRPVPSGVELAAYRVVQEALTNTVKHAAGASSTVVVDYGAEQLRVEVTDTGGASRASTETGPGRGLIGLRERLAVYGGTLHTGPRPSGGYRVTALIPLEVQ